MALTIASTLIVVFAMPALSLLYLYQIVHVPFLKMLFSIWHNLSGSFLAGYRSLKKSGKKAEKNS